MLYYNYQIDDGFFASGLSYAQTSLAQPDSGQRGPGFSFQCVGDANSQCTALAFGRQVASGARSQRPGAIQNLFPERARAADHRSEWRQPQWRFQPIGPE